MAKKEYRATDYAITFLHRVPKTEQEVKIKLLQRWYDEGEVTNAMKQLREINLINDERFVELYVESELVNKWKPILVVKQKLRQRWIDKQLVDSTIHNHREEISEWIAKAIDKDITKRKNNGEDGFTIIQKIARKWYNLDDIKKVIKQRLKDAEID